VDKNEASWLDPVWGRHWRRHFHTVKRIVAREGSPSDRRNLNRVS